MGKWRICHDAVITEVHASNSEGDLFSYDGLHIHVGLGERITLEDGPAVVISKVHQLG